MAVEEELRQIISNLVTQAETRATHLDRKLEEAERRTALFKKQRDFENLAPQRAKAFPLKTGSSYLCPYCWMSGVEIALSPIPLNGRMDLFRCRNGHELAIAN